jgi:hypothetical protein
MVIYGTRMRAKRDATLTSSPMIFLSQPRVAAGGPRA